MWGGPAAGRAGASVASREADIAGTGPSRRGYSPGGDPDNRTTHGNHPGTDCRNCTPTWPVVASARGWWGPRCTLPHSRRGFSWWVRRLGPGRPRSARPFAWTAGRTLFGWFASVLGADEETVRQHVYLSAVTRCFPGKAPGGGDRRPDPDEVARCRRWLRAEVELMRPRLVVPVGTLAIAEVMGHRGGLAEVVGTSHRLVFEGHRADVIPAAAPLGCVDLAPDRAGEVAARAGAGAARLAPRGGTGVQGRPGRGSNRLPCRSADGKDVELSYQGLHPDGADALRFACQGCPQDEGSVTGSRSSMLNLAVRSQSSSSSLLSAIAEWACRAPGRLAFRRGVLEALAGPLLPGGGGVRLAAACPVMRRLAVRGTQRRARGRALVGRAGRAPGRATAAGPLDAVRARGSGTGAPPAGRSSCCVLRVSERVGSVLAVSRTRPSRTEELQAPR